MGKPTGFMEYKREVSVAEDPKKRIQHFNEFHEHLPKEKQRLQGARCMECGVPFCQSGMMICGMASGCPLHNLVPEWNDLVYTGNWQQAYNRLKKTNNFPEFTSRVCPALCEAACTCGLNGDPVSTKENEYAIIENAYSEGYAAAKPPVVRTGKKVAVIGSGPSGLACASDLARMGYEVKIFEALHKVGGVLVYGIPEFRLPKEKIVAREVEAVKKLGVEIETDVIVGRTVTIDELMNEEGYEAVFIGSGAGLPRFMGIPGENLNGVVSANEFLTRTNLMKAYDTHYDTPIYVGQRVVVVGGGNVAMDAVRTAKRLGAEATIVYRRSEKELPARVEEVHHAKEEGIEFRMLTNPTSIIGDEKGWVVGISCVEMELGEPDESGRRSPIEKAGSDFEIPCDVVIMALGTSPNPLLKMTTEGLETNRKGCLVADEKGATTREGIFAGGDAVTGAATVILAMGAGRKAAKSIDEYIRQKKH
jgi:glutamate synthase (NADPH/NADH) small chain